MMQILIEGEKRTTNKILRGALARLRLKMLSLKKEQTLWIFKRTFKSNDITTDRSSRVLLMDWDGWIDCMPRIQSMRQCNFHRFV